MSFNAIEMREVLESTFSEYLVAIEQYIEDLKNLAGAPGAVITKDWSSGAYYLQSQPTTDEKAYDCNGKNPDIDFVSLLTSGKSCLFIGHAGTGANTGDNGGHFFGMSVTSDTTEQGRIVFISERKENFPDSFKVLNSHETWEPGWKKWEGYETVKIEHCGGDLTMHNILASKTRAFHTMEFLPVTAEFMPLTSTVGWHHEDEWIRDLGVRLRFHDPVSGCTFKGSWFAPNTHNGKWNTTRMSPLCACLSAVLKNVDCLGTGQMCINEIPKLDKNLVVTEDLNVGKSFAAFFNNPLSTIGGKTAVYTGKKTIDASGWVNLVRELNGRSANNSAIELFAKADQRYIEDVDDTAVSMPYLICTNILNGDKYQGAIQVDGTFMIGPDFMMLSQDSRKLLPSLTVDDVCHLIFKFGNQSVLYAVCGVDHATCTYPIHRQDVDPYITTGCEKVEKEITDVMNKLTGYLTDAGVIHVGQAYSQFFFHILSRRQCGGHVALLSHGQILMSKNRIMAEYEKSKVSIGNFDLSSISRVSGVQFAEIRQVDPKSPILITSDSEGGTDEEEVHETVS